MTSWCRHRIRLFAIPVLAGLLIACGSTKPLYEPFVVTQQDRAGAIHIAILDVAPWKDIAGDLEAKFTIDEERALLEAVPTTLREQEQVLDALKLALKVAFPSTGFSESRETTSGTGQETRTTRTEKTERASGDVSKVPSPETFDAKQAAGLPAVPQGAVGRDPLLVRRNALALLQAVRLMNRSVKDVARREGFAPFIVTMQISLMPYARRQPVDAYSTISFFTGGSSENPLGDSGSVGGIVTLHSLAGGGSADPLSLTDLRPYMTESLRKAVGAVGAPPPSVGLKVEFDETAIRRDLRDRLGQNLKAVDREAQLDRAVTDERVSQMKKTLDEKLKQTLERARTLKNPVAVPLLVTDNLEAGSQARASNYVRQFALAMVATIKGVAASVNLDKFRQELDTILGEDLNSLLTVGLDRTRFSWTPPSQMMVGWR